MHRRRSTNSEKSGVSLKTISSTNRVVGNKPSIPGVKESVPKLEEWKHLCPCDETTAQELLSASTQCLCEEVDLESELTLYFFNLLMESTLIEEYFHVSDNFYPRILRESLAVASRTSISATGVQESADAPKHKHLHRKERRSITHLDNKNILIGLGLNQAIAKKGKRSSKNLVKDVNYRTRRTICEVAYTRFLKGMMGSLIRFGFRNFGDVKISKRTDEEQKPKIYSDDTIMDQGPPKFDREVSFVYREDKDKRITDSSSEELIKVVYTKRRPSQEHKTRILMTDALNDHRRRSPTTLTHFSLSRRLSLGSGIFADRGDVRKRALARQKSRERRRAETASQVATNLLPITEDNMADSPNEKLLSTTNFEYDWLVKRDEKAAKITFKNGNRYEGEVFDKVPQGKGTFWWADGTVYEGEFQDGSPTGKGRMQLADFTEYTGTFYRGSFHGSGVYNIRTTSMVYSGSWKCGKKHGFGWLLYESGVWYEGEFREDLRNGKGFFQFKDKSCYEGNYSKNKREGQGAMRWSNNDIYIGQWSDGFMHGSGEYSWKTEFDKFFSFSVQHYYKGTWNKGRRNGTGVMFFGNENGAKMAGYFQDNFKHGAAIVVCGNGRSIERNPLFYNDKPLHVTPSHEEMAKRSSSDSFNDQLYQEVIKTGCKEKQWPTRNRTSQLATLLEHVKQEKGALCSPIEIQIHSSPEDVELYYYIEKALSMYVNAFDTIQFDLNSSESCSSSSNCSRVQLSKWNLMTLYSADGKSKVVKTQENQAFCGRPSLLNQNAPLFNKSESRIQQTVKCEEKYLRNVILRHLPKLMEVYYHYATITAPKKVYYKHYMCRMFLWQLYLDIGITKSGISLVEIDNMLDENPASFIECCHHPFEHIYFFQFIQSLMGTALLVHHRSREEVHSTEGLMPYIFQKFLLDRVFPHAGSHQGRCLFEFKDILPIKDIYALYLKLGQPHTARTFLNATCTKKGEDPPCYKTWSKNKSMTECNAQGQNVNIMGHNFLYIQEKENVAEPKENPMHLPEEADPYFQDLSTFRVLGAKMVVKCLCTICPPILKNDIICNMDYPMTFLEFYEVLICCTLLMVARTKKRQEIFGVLSARVHKSDDNNDSLDTILRKSGKVKKRK